MEPLSKQLKELVQGDVKKGLLYSEYAVGWVINIVIESKKWNPSKVILRLDTRHMRDLIKQTHFPISTLEQLTHEFSGLDTFSVLNMNQAFHQIEMDRESSKLFVFTTPFSL